MNHLPLLKKNNRPTIPSLLIIFNCPERQLITVTDWQLLKKNIGNIFLDFLASLQIRNLKLLHIPKDKEF